MPGVLACGVVAAAATFLSEHYGAPVMLFALLLGMAMNFLSAEGPCAAGIEFTARQRCASVSHYWACVSPSSRSQRWAGIRCCWWWRPWS